MEFRKKRNTPIFTIVAVVKKMGRRWVYVEEDFEPVATELTMHDDRGLPHKDVLMRLPYYLFIQFDKDRDLDFEVGTKYTFHVYIRYGYDFVEKGNKMLYYLHSHTKFSSR